jgi:MFS family permease
MTDTAESAAAPSIEEPTSLPKVTAMVLAYGMLISAIGNNFLITILPPLGRDMGLGEFQVGIVLAIGGFFMLITGPFWGRLSENWGRKKVILIGSLGYVVTTAAFAFTIDLRLAGAMTAMVGFFALVAIRGLYSLSSGAIYPATMAMVGDMTSRKNRASGVALISAAWGFGSVIGPAIAAVFSSLSPTAPFYVVTVMGMAMVAFYIYYLHEPDRHREPEKVGFRHILTPKVLSVVGGFSLLILGNVAMMVCLGFHFQDTFGFGTAQTAQNVGIALMASAFMQIIVQVGIIPRLKWTPRRMINTGMPLAIIGTLIVMSAPTFLVAIGGMVLFGLGGGVGWPAYMTAASLAAGTQNQGSMAGLTAAFQASGFMIGPIIGTLAYQIDGSYPFIMCASLLGITIVMANTLPMPTADEYHD